MPTEPHTPTLAEIVRRAADVADPNGADDHVTELITRFEDRDEPASTVLDVEQELAEAHQIIDPDRDSDALTTAVAVATYLAFKRDEIADDPEHLISRAMKAEDVA